MTEPNGPPEGTFPITSTSLPFPGKKVFTDYPFVGLDDHPQGSRPEREVTFLRYDGNKYATIRLPNGKEVEVKLGYLWRRERVCFLIMGTRTDLEIPEGEVESAQCVAEDEAVVQARLEHLYGGTWKVEKDHLSLTDEFPSPPQFETFKKDGAKYRRQFKDHGVAILFTQQAPARGPAVSPADLYALEPLRIERSPWRLCKGFESPIPEYEEYQFRRDAFDNEKHFEIRLVADVYQGQDESETLLSIWLYDVPVMIVQLYGEDESNRYITNVEQYRRLIAYLSTKLEPRSDVTQRDVVPADKPLRALTSFYNSPDVLLNGRRGAT